MTFELWLAPRTGALCAVGENRSGCEPGPRAPERCGICGEGPFSLRHDAREHYSWHHGLSTVPPELRIRQFYARGRRKQCH